MADLIPDSVFDGVDCERGKVTDQVDSEVWGVGSEGRHLFLKNNPDDGDARGHMTIT